MHEYMPVWVRLLRGCTTRWTTCRAGHEGRSIRLGTRCAAWLPECLLESEGDDELLEEVYNLQGRAGRCGKLG